MSEYAVGNEKWKSHFMQFSTSIHLSFWNLEPLKDEKVNLKFTWTAWKPLASWNGTFFIPRSAATSRREQLTKLLLNIQFHNHVGIQIRRTIGKNGKSACVFYQSKVICLHFIQRNLWLYVDQIYNLFFTEMSPSTENLQFWGEMIAQEISGSKLVLHVPLLLSGSWSFWDIDIFEELVGFLLQIFVLSKKNRLKSSLVLSGEFFYKMNLSVWFWSVPVKNDSGSQSFFPKSNPSTPPPPPSTDMWT